MNENRNDWDEHIFIILFSYRTTFKVRTAHTLFEFVYGLHPLLPMEYILPLKLGQSYDLTPVRVLTS
jgi:hypothetical protein